MLLSHRKNGLTSLFKEVRVFKGRNLGESSLSQSRRNLCLGRCQRPVPAKTRRIPSNASKSRHAPPTPAIPKEPFRIVFGTESDSVVFYYSVVNSLRIVIHFSKHSTLATKRSDSLHFRPIKNVTGCGLNPLF